MIDADQRDALSARCPRQRGLEIGDGEVGVKFVQLPHQPIHQGPELAGLIIEPCRYRSHHVEPPVCVLEQDARDLFDPHPRMPIPEPVREQLPCVGRCKQQNVVIAFEVFDERADPRGVTTPFTAQADGDFRHRKLLRPYFSRLWTQSSLPSRPESQFPRTAAAGSQTVF